MSDLDQTRDVEVCPICKKLSFCPLCVDEITDRGRLDFSCLDCFMESQARLAALELEDVRSRLRAVAVFVKETRDFDGTAKCSASKCDTCGLAVARLHKVKGPGFSCVMVCDNEECSENIDWEKRKQNWEKS